MKYALNDLDSVNIRKIVREANRLRKFQTQFQDDKRAVFLVQLLAQHTESGLYLTITEYLEVNGEKKVFYLICFTGLLILKNGDLKNTIEKFRLEKLLFSFSMLRKIASDLVSGIEFLHKNDIVHRNINPQNVFWDPHCAKLGNLDQAAQNGFLDDTFDAARDELNCYMSPEFLHFRYFNGRKEVLTKKIDVWSAGCVIYEVACLEKAFECAYSSPNELYKMTNSQEKSLNIDEFKKDKEGYNLINELISRY